ncbi:MAG: hypothetical protein FH749_14710 [Firmicutes bacterium]|nr:hypothetical protein [Bacillota bacterium]
MRVLNFFSRMHPVSEPGYKPVARQYWEMLWLAARHRLSPTEYYLYQLGRRDMNFRQLRDYIITAFAVKKLRPRLNPRMWEVVLRNKALFHSHMSQKGLPVAKLYGIFHPGFGNDNAGNPLHTPEQLHPLVEQRGCVVLKPLGGLKGQQIMVLRAGEQLTPEQKQSLLAGAGFLVEEHLQNVPELAQINPDSLNTCRVVTFLGSDGQVQILFATARFGRKGQNTDNWSAGGIAAGVDVNSGRLGPGLLLPQFGGGWHQRHPDSGICFTETVIPDWQAVRELAEKAALSLPWCRAIGWDIAVTPGGAVLVEGNGQWNPALGQAFVGGLLTPELRRELTACGLRFPA